MGTILKCLLTFCLLWMLPAIAQEEPSFFSGRKMGELSDPELMEVSGMLASRANEGLFWAHNDSGDEARFFLLDSMAQIRATYYLEGIDAIDWEDIAYLERDGKGYLVLADIGDNKAKRPDVSLHIVAEPTSYAGHPSVDTIRKNDITTFVLRYPDGPRDAEALFFDPIDEQLYLFSKRDLQARIYRFPLSLKEKQDTLVVKHCGTLPYTFITGADISPDGGEVLVKNLLNVYYWKRRDKESLVSMFLRRGKEQPYETEPQGEAIAFGLHGEGYYTLSERPLGLGVYLMAYARR